MNESVFRQILNNNFNPKGLTLKGVVSIGQEIADSRKVSHRLLGKLGMIITQIPETMSLKEFSRQIGIPYNAMRTYRLVEEKLQGEDLPDNISWAAQKALAYTDNPHRALKTIKEKKLTNREIVETYGKK